MYRSESRWQNCRRTPIRASGSLKAGVDRWKSPMEIKGEYKIAAPRDKVFAALNDQAILQACIPGCETLEKLSDTEMTAKVRLRIGPVSAGFSGKVTLSDIDPPNGYRISGEGKGSVGFAKGGAAVTLADADGGTRLSYTVDA